ncbi:MAG: DUF1330 domain-containing protein [Acidimicrobiaceae bacterium]|nr:DUF1330 domain-containing protein [Acidimicrobiaceae bacterium]MYH78900.1 DUF1330 domain-containing protein [Acidimicrobiaceae bacterium]MYK76603.1 DUF1330 domain-containing protein [Acidimicrobiaceae bacterium]
MFLIIDAKVTDRDAYVETAKQWTPAAHTAERHGGQLLVCGDQVEVIAGDWKPKNLLIVQFPDAESMRSWVGSSDYQEMVEVVSQSAEMSTVAVSTHSE